MKLSIALLLMVCVFSSCASTNRIMEIKGSHKETKGFKLIQNPKASSSEKTGRVIVNQFFNTRTTYLFEERNNQKPVVSLEFNSTKPIRANELDSVMYLNLDNEKIRIVASENKQKMAENIPASSVEIKPATTLQTTASQKDNNELITRRFEVPENLWLSIAHSKTIFFKLSLGKKGIEVKLNPEETIQLKKFFSRAMQRRIEIVPLVPPGKVKW